MDPGTDTRGCRPGITPTKPPNEASSPTGSPFQPFAASPAAGESGASGSRAAAAEAGSSAARLCGPCPRPQPAGCAAPACQLPASCLLLQWLRNGDGSPLVGNTPERRAKLRIGARGLQPKERVPLGLRVPICTAIGRPHGSATHPASVPVCESCSPGRAAHCPAAPHVATGSPR